MKELRQFVCSGIDLKKVIGRKKGKPGAETITGSYPQQRDRPRPEWSRS